MRFDKAYFSQYLKTNQLRVIVFIFIVLSLIKIALSLPFNSPYVMLDEFYYDILAQNVVHGNLFINSPLFVTVPPGYSIVISIAYMISSDKVAIYHIMLIINAILTASIVFPIYFILRKYCSNILSIFGALIIATLPSITSYSFILFSENLFIPLFVYSIWFIHESYGTNKKIWQLLAGSSITLLYMTRSTGLAMILGFVASFIYYMIACLVKDMSIKGLYHSVKSKFMLIASFLFTFLLWLVYTSNNTPKGSYTAMGSPYSTSSSYVVLLSSSVNSLDVFVNYIRLLLNEIDYLVISTYLVILIVFIYMVIKLYSEKKARTSIIAVTAIYGIVSSICLLVITLTFMYDYGISKSEIFFLIFGRYIEPALPVIFLFGLIGLDDIYKKCTLIGTKAILCIVAAYLASIFLFIWTVPQYYKFPDNPSIYFLKTAKNMFTMNGTYLIVAAFLLAIVIVFCLSLYYKKLKILLFGVFIISSIIIFIPSYYSQLGQSNAFGDQNCIGTYLQKNSNMNYFIAIDNRDFNSVDGLVMAGEAQFWTNETISLSSLANLTDPQNITNSDNKKANYIISSKILPLEFVSETNGYKLYKPKVTSSVVNTTVQLPYTIYIGTNDSMITENFFGPEGGSGNTFRWTKDNSIVIVNYPRVDKDMRLTLSLRGDKPDNSPINISVSMNGYHLGNITKPSGYHEYSFIVPQRIMTDLRQELDIRTETWDQENYGIQDARWLGVAINKIYVETANVSST